MLIFSLTDIIAYANPGLFYSTRLHYPFYSNSFFSVNSSCINKKGWIFYTQIKELILPFNLIITVSFRIQAFFSFFFWERVVKTKLFIVEQKKKHLK